MSLEFDLPPDGAEELTALLERSGVEYLRDGGRFRFRFASRGCTWQTVCDCQGQLVLVYGVHPARVVRPETALALCAQLNSRVVQGAFFLWEERLVFRTSARLSERFQAQAQLCAVLEYNAAALSGYWEQLSAGAQGLPPNVWIRPGPGHGFGEDPTSK